MLLHQTPKVENIHDLLIMCFTCWWKPSRVPNFVLKPSTCSICFSILLLLALLMASTFYVVMPHWLCFRNLLLSLACYYWFYSLLFFSSSETSSSSNSISYQPLCSAGPLAGTYSIICCCSLFVELCHFFYQLIVASCPELYLQNSYSDFFLPCHF